MKKLMFVLILLAAGTVITNAQFTNAQLEKGTIMIGASTGINHHSSGSGSGLASLGFSNITYTETYEDGGYTEESKSSSISILPRGGYFIMDNFAAGAGINYSRSKEEYDYEGAQKQFTTVFSFEPFLRYYYPLDFITPFVEASAGFGGVYYKTISEDINEPIKNNNPLSTFAGGVGLSFPIGLHASFDFMTSYTRLKVVSENEFYESTNKQGTLGINFGFKVFLGGPGSGINSSY